MKSIYEEADGTYTRQGDYELPNLKVSPEKEIEIGVWGQRYRRYLKQYHKIRYYNLLTSGTLNGHLAEVDQQAERMFQLLVSVLSKQENVTEELKAKHPMELSLIHILYDRASCERIRKIFFLKVLTLTYKKRIVSHIRRAKRNVFYRLFT